MKERKKQNKKRFIRVLSVIIVLAVVFSLVPVSMIVNAAPGVLSIKYERIRENTIFGPTERNRLYIYGNEFSSPKVKAGAVSELPLPINDSLSDEDVIVIDEQDALDDIEGIINNIIVYNDGIVDITAGGIVFDLTSIPTISSTSTAKVYVGSPLGINGLSFSNLDLANDDLFVAGTKYSLNDPDVSIDSDSRITIDNVKAPINTGLSKISVTRKLGGDPKYQITSTLDNSIKVVGQLTGIEVERIDPNSGARNKKNIINIYGTSGNSNFDSNMRIFIPELNGLQTEATNKGTILDTDGLVIGLKVELPTRSTAGAVNLLLTTPDLGSEFLITNGFIYLDVGNFLTINDGGITPNYKKETEYKEITIKGRNIGNFYAGAYDKLEAGTIVKPVDTLIGYSDYLTYNDPLSYKVKYFGVYDGTTNVTILREIKVFIDGDAVILNSPAPVFAADKDIVTVIADDVNLDPKEDKTVDVSIQTTTTVFDEATATEYYSRSEEYIVNDGFTYRPNELSPNITSITPQFAPNDEEIYITIEGEEFQVLEDGSLPQVRIGGRTIVDVRIYDENNKVVDGKIIGVGTKLKLIMIPPTPVEAGLAGAVDVVVVNPSGGQMTLSNGFEYRNSNIIDRPAAKLPIITNINPDLTDIKGGQISGELIQITGANFDTSADSNHRVVVTIDGVKAEIDGKVSSDGKNITIIPPPGTVPGMTKLQIINEDGSMTSADFEYRLVTSAPEITKIIPNKGGKGTKLIIKGVDFILPDITVAPDDPRRKGSVVLLNGMELNAYNYLPTGTVTEIGGSIYYEGSYDPDGAGPLEAYDLDGEMIKVQDITTIYIDIPDKFYKFLAGVSPYLDSENVPLGDLTLEVLNPDGARTKEDVKFTYLNPATNPTINAVNGIVPDNGSINGGTIVTITGTNFKQDDLEVYFGPEQSENIQFISSTELRALVPILTYNLPVGSDQLAVPVMVLNYDGGAAVRDDGFTYRIPGSNPIITSLSPSNGSSAGNEEVIIRGTDFRRQVDNSGIPKVYFNGKEAEVTWYGSGNISEILTVKTPASKIDGPVDVTIVNYDSGSYTYKSFTYERSTPNITTVTPDKISKLGNVTLQINGTNFKKADFTDLTTNPLEQVDRNTFSPTDASDVIDTLVAFGDATTGDKKIIDTVIGPYYTIMDNLRIDFRSIEAGVAKIKISNSSDGSTIRNEIDIPIGESHLFIINGQTDLGNDKIVDEGILVEITPNQAIVTRRIAPYAKWENNGLQLTVKTPPISTVGDRNLYVINSDGGTAAYNITVTDPASNPKITYISPRNKVKRDTGITDYVSENKSLDMEYYTYVPLEGGTFVTINGSDFRRNVKVYVDNKEVEIISKGINDDQLLIKIPKGTEADLDKLYRIIVQNEDGGVVDSTSMTKAHYIVYKKPESTPIIESVIPGETSGRGENSVRIIGDDFRTGIKVFIDGTECTQVTLVSYRELLVTVPKGLSLGSKIVQVMNPDYGFYEKDNAVTILSSPEIMAVYDHRDFLMDEVVFSIEGGQSITLQGVDFMENAQVIIGGALKSVIELEEGEVGIECNNINDANMVIVGGQQATDIQVEGTSVIRFITPTSKVGETSIIVLNQDGGVSNVIDGSYQKPFPDSPTGVFVEVVDSDTLKLEWDRLEEIRYYELYVSISKTGVSNNNYMYLGSVSPHAINDLRLRSYIDGLDASTWYSVKLKSVNAYGASRFSPASSYVRTSDTKLIQNYQDELNTKEEIKQEDTIIVSDNNLNYNIGEKSIGNYGTGAILYFDQPMYSTLNPKTIGIGLELLKEYPNNNIKINDRGITITMLSKNLMTVDVYEIPSSKHSDSKMFVELDKELGSRGDDIRLRVPFGYKIVTAPFRIGLEMQVEKQKTVLNSFNGELELKMDYSTQKKNLYRGGIYVAFYDTETKKVQILTTSQAINASKAQISKTGEYMLLGKLR